MGLFDTQSTDHTGTIQQFTTAAAAFAKMDLNTMFKLGASAMTDMISDAKKVFSQLFGHSDCNDQDRVLVERMTDQIPHMGELLSDLGYYDKSIGDMYRKHEGDVAWIRKIMTDMGRPHGPEPCNSLIGPARLIFTILFGVRILNSNFLDALEQGPDAYYRSGGAWLNDIPRVAVDRAVMLRQHYFPGSTYNNNQWDLNIFQQFPLVAPVPDPEKVGVLYTGSFMGVDIINGMIIGDPIPDVDAYTNAFRNKLVTLKAGVIMPINKLPDLHLPGSGGIPKTSNPPPPTNTNTNTNTNTSTTDGGIFGWAKAHPLETVGILAVLALAVNELLDE